MDDAVVIKIEGKPQAFIMPDRDEHEFREMVEQAELMWQYEEEREIHQRELEDLEEACKIQYAPLTHDEAVWGMFGAYSK